jgi:Flp pilus assembly protein TadD
VPHGDSRSASRRLRVRPVVVCLALIAGLVLASHAVAQTVPVTAPAALNLVVPFQNASGEPRIYWLSEGSAILLTDDLGSLGVPVIRREDRLRAFERLRVPPVATLSHATVIRLGQVVGAAQVVIGSFELDGQTLIVRARTIRLDTGRISPELIERGPLTDLLSTYERLARRIGPANVTETALTRTYPTLPAFEQYIKGLLAEAPAAQIAFLTQAIKLYPGFQRARVALWDVHTALGEHKQALAIAQAVPASSPLSRQARFLAGVSMINLGEHQAAFEAFTALNRDRPDPALLNNLGVVQLRRPRPAGQPAPGGTAVAYFGEAVKLDGSDPDLFFNLGYAYWLNRDMAGAIHWLREAVRRNPADDEAHYVLGTALQTAGNAAEAAREHELARQLGVNAATSDLERLKFDIDVADSLRVAAALWSRQSSGTSATSLRFTSIRRGSSLRRGATTTRLQNCDGRSSWPPTRAKPTCCWRASICAPAACRRRLTR